MRAVRHQSTCIDEFARHKDGRQLMLGRELDDELLICLCERIDGDQERVDALLACAVERRHDVGGCPHVEQVGFDARDRVASWNSFQMARAAALLMFEIEPTRVRPGTISLISSACLLGRSISNELKPVRLPPGRARLRTTSRGSATAAMTTGIVLVASLAATAAGVPRVTIKSTLRLRSSATSAGKRSGRPSAER